MTEDRFLERLRQEGRQLRYEPADGALWTRLTARIDERVRSQPAIAQLLAGWFRPVATTLGVVSIGAALSVLWMERVQEPSTVEAMVSASSLAADLAIDGDALSVE